MTREVPVLNWEGNLRPGALWVARFVMQWPDDEPRIMSALAASEHHLLHHVLPLSTGEERAKAANKGPFPEWNAEFNAARAAGFFAGRVLGIRLACAQHHPELRISTEKAIALFLEARMSSYRNKRRNRDARRRVRFPTNKDHYRKEFWPKFKSVCHLWAAHFHLQERGACTSDEFYCVAAGFLETGEKLGIVKPEWDPWRVPSRWQPVTIPFKPMNQETLDTLAAFKTRDWSRSWYS